MTTATCSRTLARTLKYTRLQAAILQSEGIKLQRINEALGDAEAMIARATASAKAVRAVASSLQADGSRDAVSMKIAEDYIQVRCAQQTTRKARLCERSN